MLFKEGLYYILTKNLHRPHYQPWNTQFSKIFFWCRSYQIFAFLVKFVYNFNVASFLIKMELTAQQNW